MICSKGILNHNQLSLFSVHKEEAGNPLYVGTCFIPSMPVAILAGLVKKRLDTREWASLSAPGFADEVVDISLDKICNVRPCVAKRTVVRNTPLLQK